MEEDRSSYASLGDLRRLRIVLADDEQILTCVLQAQLCALGHRVVGIASNGSEALSLAQETKPDVVIMDAHMPVMDGPQATRCLMVTSPVCIVLLSGDPGLSELAEQSGAMMYVVKPLNPSRIQAVLSRAYQRFQWYLRIWNHGEQPELALREWLAFQNAVKALAQDKNVSEDEAALLIENTWANRHNSDRKGHH